MPTSLRVRKRTMNRSCADVDGDVAQQDAAAVRHADNVAMRGQYTILLGTDHHGIVGREQFGLETPRVRRPWRNRRSKRVVKIEQPALIVAAHVRRARQLGMLQPHERGPDDARSLARRLRRAPDERA